MPAITNGNPLTFYKLNIEAKIRDDLPHQTTFYLHTQIYRRYYGFTGKAIIFLNNSQRNNGNYLCVNQQIAGHPVLHLPIDDVSH